MKNQHTVRRDFLQIMLPNCIDGTTLVVEAETYLAVLRDKEEAEEAMTGDREVPCTALEPIPLLCGICAMCYLRVWVNVRSTEYGRRH
jgi:hypothetical protein